MGTIPPVPPVTDPPPATPPPANPGSAPIAPPGPAPAPAPAPAAPPADPASDVGDAGKRAIEAERKAARDALTAQQAAEKRVTDLQAELEQLRKGPLSDADKAIAEAEAKGRSEATAASNARILEAEVKLAAAGKLADPTDAVKFLDLTQFKVGDDGSIEGDVAAAIEKLVTDKPYLASASATPPKPGPVGGGPQGTLPAVTRDSLKQMTAQQIAELDPKLVDQALAAP